MKKTIAYLQLIFVVFIWGISPQFTLFFYKHYSPLAYITFGAAVSFVAYLAISGKHIKEFNLSYILPGVLTGIFLALANMSQKIGLLYTTPAKYAFLENLSCISVPILMYILLRKKPNIVTIFSCLMCLAGVLLLNGISFNMYSSWGIGETLCAAAGILYGFNITGAAVYARRLYTPLFLAVQTLTTFIIYLISTLIFNNISVGKTGKPLEKIVFTWQPKYIILMAVVILITSAFCWTIRTNVLKTIDATVVSVIMPFTAVITTVVSIIRKTDQLSVHFVVGAIVVLAAIILSSCSDIIVNKISKSSKKPLI